MNLKSEETEVVSVMERSDGDRNGQESVFLDKDKADGSMRCQRGSDDKRSDRPDSVLMMMSEASTGCPEVSNGSEVVLLLGVISDYDRRLHLFLNCGDG